MSDLSIVDELYGLVCERKADPPEGSYTAKLFAGGLDRICKKVGEEATEVVIAAKNRSRAELAYESADLVYHLLVLWAESGLTPEDVWAELARRRQQSRGSGDQ